MIKVLEHLSYEHTPRESILKGGTCEKGGKRLFSRACCNRTRGYGFKPKQGKFKIDRRKKFFYDNSKTLEQALQRGGQCPIPENVQSQVEQDSKQSGLVEDVPDNCRGVGLDEF